MILSLLFACGSENQIIDPNYDCASDEVQVAPITYELTCPEIPACPDVHLSCPEVTIPECPPVNVVCPEPVVTVEAPVVTNESPDIYVEPSQCGTVVDATCTCPEVVIPECPSLENVTVELDAELTINGDDFLTELANLVNGPQDLVFYMESEERGTGTYVLFENNDTRDFILTGVRIRDHGWDCSFQLYLNGDTTQDLTFLSSPQANNGVSLTHSLLGSNGGAIPMAPGDTIDLSVTCTGGSNPNYVYADEYQFAMMGYYQ